jgi:peptidoglycan LD-endopeptidase LytH
LNFRIDRHRPLTEYSPIMVTRLSVVALPLLALGIVVGALAPGSRTASADPVRAAADGGEVAPAGPDRTRHALPSSAALGALRSALVVTPPYQERGRLGSGDAGIGYRVPLLPGDTLRVTVTTLGGPVGPAAPAIRLHAYRPAHLEAETPYPIASGSVDGPLVLIADEPGDVIVLLHGDGGGAGFTTRIERSGALVFPVAGRGPDDVVGHFLDIRDGGRRAHHGVDIGAPAGNPVRAVANGVIERVETTPLGGLTIRLIEDRTGHIHYYAHLSAALVEAGQRVTAGRTIGAVGNTGNARNTPPHLHYGVFDGSDILDPMKILRPEPAGFLDEAPSELLGARGRVLVAGAAKRPVPARMGPGVSLTLHQPVEILAETDRYFRVRIDDREGYLAQWVVEPLR